MTLKGAIEVNCFHLSDFFQKKYVSEYIDHACHKTKQHLCNNSRRPKFVSITMLPETMITL